MSASPRLVCIGPLLVLLALLPAPAAGQEGPGALLLNIRSATTSLPVAGAEIRVRGSPFRWRTERNGMVRIKGLAATPATLHVSAPLYESAEFPVDVQAGETTLLALELDPKVIPLEPLAVTGEQRSRYLDQQGFYARKVGGRGAFITRAELEKHAHQPLSDALRKVPGISLARRGLRDAQASMSRSAGAYRCPIQYFLDGIPAAGYNVDDMPRTNVEGIEIYRGASEIPVEFNSRAGTSICGAIVIWTRVEG